MQLIDAIVEVIDPRSLFDLGEVTGKALDYSLRTGIDCLKEHVRKGCWARHATLRISVMSYRLSNGLNGTRTKTSTMMIRRQADRDEVALIPAGDNVLSPATATRGLSKPHQR